MSRFWSSLLMAVWSGLFVCLASFLCVPCLGFTFLFFCWSRLAVVRVEVRCKLGFRFQGSGSGAGAGESQGKGQQGQAQGE